MDIRFTAEDEAFRAEVRAFLRQAWTPDLAARIDAEATYPQAIIEWQRRLFERGWVAPGWPKAHGGCEWTPTQRYLYDLERSAIGAPEVLPFGIKMVGPVIIKFGTRQQQQRFLPRILRGDDWWCQGYSEPGAGSDLAALKTRADRVGDDYVLNGSKIWTTYAQHADWMFCLVRTDTSARRQDGISFLLVDMKTPGIRIRPIVSIDGEHSLNEVFFDGVRVPVAHLVGEQDKGWTVAKSLLAHERTAIAGVGDSWRRVRRLRALARRETGGGRPLLDDPAFALRLADVEIELMALEVTDLRAPCNAAKGQGPGAESSLLKIKGTEVQQAIQQLAMDLAGCYGAVLQGTLDTQALGQFGVTIGSFQALQHRLVDMHNALEQTRSLLMRAVCAADDRQPDAKRCLHALKAMVGKAGRLIGGEAIQMHGGMGMTDELAIGHFVKRLMVIQTTFGDADWHRQRFAALADAG